jgi:nicotinamidase-related amidase
MAIRGKRATLSEKGLLTPDNCVFAFVDLLPEMLFHVANIDPLSVINANAMLAKTALAFDVPVVFSTLRTKAYSREMWPQVTAIFTGITPIPRTTMSPWDDPHFVGGIERTGRRRIVLSGLWTQTSVAFAAVQALHDGYEAFVVEDSCGDLSQRAHANAMDRMIQAGAKPVTALSVLLELQRDWGVEGPDAAVMDIVRAHAAGRFGSGFEHPFAAPATTPPVDVTTGVRVGE